MIVRLERPSTGVDQLRCTDCGEVCAIDHGHTVVLTHVGHNCGAPNWELPARALAAKGAR
jgi:hypothetical protein